MRSNILSLGQLLERGYMIFMKERILYLRDQDNRLLAQIEMTKKYMYKLKLINVQARYFLKEKSEVFSIFKKFKVLIENLSGERIKALRSDRVANIYQKSV
jgi:hypothetical protein